MNTESIIQQWMDDCRDTLANYDVAGHLELISKSVKVHGVPDLDIIDYNDWAAQVRHEFAEKTVKSVGYNGLQIRSENETQVMFTTVETVIAADDAEIVNRLEVVLSKEEDGQWRVVQERLLDAAEFAHYHYNLPTN